MSASKRVDFYAPILTKGRDEEGVLWISGKITGPDLDNDQQRMDAGWLKTAVPAWAQVGNVREQHNPRSAVGKAVEVWENETGDWHMRAKIVDPSAALKVEHGVYSGFSIGVANPTLVKSQDAPKGKCAGGRLVEVSVVDRPALPSCVLTVAKAEGATAALLPVDEQHERLVDADGTTEKLDAPEVLEKGPKGKKKPPFPPRHKGSEGDEDDDDDEKDEKDEKDGDGADGDEGPPWAKTDDGGFSDLVHAVAEAALAKFTRAYLEDVAVEKGIDVPALLKSEGVDVNPEDDEDEDDPLAALSDTQIADAVLAGLSYLTRSESFADLTAELADVVDPGCLPQTMALMSSFSERESDPDLELADQVDRSYRETLAKAQAALSDEQIKTTPAPSPAEPIRPPAPRVTKPNAETATKAAGTPPPAADLGAQLNDAITKAMEPLTARLAEVQASNERMRVQMESTPRGGGPAVTSVGKADRAELNRAEEAARLTAQADAARASGDLVLEAGYRQLLKNLSA